MKALILSAAGMLLVRSLACAAQVDVRHIEAIDDHVHTGEGFFFALPRTVIAADVSIDAKTFKPGGLARYAIFYFPETFKDNGDPTGSNKSFNLKDVSFSSRGEPDPAWVFWANVKSRMFLDRALTLQMTEAGSVTGATTTVDNSLPDFITGVLGTASSLGAKAILAGQALDCGTVDTKEKFVFCRLMRQDAQKITDYQDVLAHNPQARSAAQTAFGEIDQDTSGGFRIRPSSGLAKADEIFESYQQLDSLKINAVQNPSPGVGIGDRVTQIDSLSQEIRKQFVGATNTSSWTGRFEFRPANGETEWGLMNLDSKRGACLNATFYVGKTALTKDFFAPRQDYACPANEAYTVQALATVSADDLESRIRSKVKQYEKSKTGQGMPYRIPADVRFRIQSDGKSTPFASNILVAQAGLVLALPAKLGGRQTKTGLTYFEATGAVKTLDSSGKTLVNKSLADAAGSSATSVVDTNLAAQKAAAAKADPLAELTRKRELLEEQSKIRALCASLGISDCVAAPKPQ